MPNVCIIGTTSWGKALASIIGHKKTPVIVWARTEAEADLLNNGSIKHKIPRLFPSKGRVTDSLPEALEEANVVIFAVPSQTMRRNARLVKDHIKESTIVVSAAKGLEIGSNKRMSEVLIEELGEPFRQNLCVISGPNLAKEIMDGAPAATVAAAEDEAIARKIQRLLENDKFCVYTNSDVIGVELGGALKNVIALGAGIADGLGYGNNAKAAFVTRGLTEISALGVALGASPLTFSGLAGLGDLIATSASPLSRNHYVGRELAKGASLKQIMRSMKEVAEGVPTTKAAWELALRFGIAMPITQKVYQVLYEDLPVKQAAEELMGGKTSHELEGRRWKLLPFFKRKE